MKLITKQVNMTEKLTEAIAAAEAKLQSVERIEITPLEYSRLVEENKRDVNTVPYPTHPPEPGPDGEAQILHFLGIPMTIVV